MSQNLNIYIAVVSCVVVIMAACGAQDPVKIVNCELALIKRRAVLEFSVHRYLVY